MIGFKIPRWTEQLLHSKLWDEGLPEEVSNFYKGEKVIFLIRDVKDTIASMMKLAGPVHRWLDTYPPEIIRAKTAKCPSFKDTFSEDLAFVRSASDPVVASGALYWKYKTKALYNYAGVLPLFALQYRDLVEESATALPKICAFLDIPWEAELLDHPRFSHPETFPNGRTLGDTNPQEPIHNRSIGQWKDYLNKDQLNDIECIAGEMWDTVSQIPTGLLEPADVFR